VEPELNAEIDYRAKSAEGKGAASVLSGAAGGPVDDFDRFWQWANKPRHSRLTIPARPFHIAAAGRHGATEPRSMRPCARCEVARVVLHLDPKHEM
jgi:hypothetical protein